MENKELLKIIAVNNNENIDLQKEVEFELFALWLSIPPLLKNPPKQKDGSVPSGRAMAISMGIDDEGVLDLCELKTNLDFSARYDVHINTLTTWKKKIKEKGATGLPMMQNWAQTMSSNLLMSLYQHAMKKGNPLTIKLWFQLVDNWKENIKVDHVFTPVESIEHDIYETKPKLENKVD